MIVNELVTVLKYKLENSKDMKIVMTSVNNLNKKGRELQKNLRIKAKAVGLGQIKVRLQQAQARANELRKRIEQSSRAFKKSASNAQRLKLAQDKATQSANRMSSAYSRIGGYIRMAVVALGGLNAAKMMDESASIQGRLNISADKGNTDNVRKQIYDNSLQSGTSFDSNIDLFSSVARNKESLGLNDQSSVKLSEIVGKAVALTGGDAGTDSAVITQFGQALSSGVLRGDELNSILEGSGGLAMAIADGFGTSVNQLREMGQAGKLTSKELAEGLLKQADAVNKKFELLPKKFSQGMTNLHTILVEKIGKPLNAMTDWGQKFFDLTKYINDNFQEIATKVGAAGLAGALTYAVANAKKLMLALRPMLKTMAIFYALYLIGEDIMVWMQGGDSLIGSWLGNFQDVKKELEWIIKPISDFVKKLSEGEGGLGKWVGLASIAYLAFKMFKGPIALITRGIMFLAPLLLGLSAPVWFAIAAAVALASAAYLIYKNWDEIVGFFGYICDEIVGWFSDTWKLLKTDTVAGLGKIGKAILDWSPVGLFYKAFAGVMSYFGIEMPDKLTDFINQGFEKIKTAVLSWSPVDWFVSIFTPAFDWVDEKFGGIGKAIGDTAAKLAIKFGWADAKEEPKKGGIPNVGGAVGGAIGLYKMAKKAAKKADESGMLDKVKGHFGGADALKVNPPSSTINRTQTNNQTNHQTFNITTMDNPQAISAAAGSATKSAMKNQNLQDYNVEARGR